MRDFPQALTRQVRAAALLRGVTINEMLTILVRDGLRVYLDPLAGPGTMTPLVPAPAEPPAGRVRDSIDLTETVERPPT